MIKQASYKKANESGGEAQKRSKVKYNEGKCKLTIYTDWADKI